MSTSTTEYVYVCRDPQVVAAWRHAVAADTAHRRDVAAQAAALGKKLGPLALSDVMGPPTIIGLAVDDPADPPAGWQIIADAARPHFVPEPGDTAAEQLLAGWNDYQRADPRGVLEQHGLPRQTMLDPATGSLGQPGIAWTADAVFALYSGGRPVGWERSFTDATPGPLWTPCARADFDAADQVDHTDDPVPVITITTTDSYVYETAAAAAVVARLGGDDDDETDATLETSHPEDDGEGRHVLHLTLAGDNGYDTFRITVERVTRQLATKG